MYEALLMIFIVYGAMLFFNIRAKYYLSTLAFVLSILAYGYDPLRAYYEYGIYTDLVRISNDIDMFRLYGDDYAAYVAAPLSRWYVSSFALFSENSLIASVSAMLFYGSSFTILYRVGRAENADEKTISAAGFLLVAITNYNSVIGNIRYPIATAVFVGLFYLDAIRHSIKARILYIVLPLFHPGSIIYLLMRLVTRKKMLSVFLFFLALAGILFANIELVFSILIGFADIYFQDMQSKLEVYSDVSNFSEPTAAIYVWSFLQVIYLVYLLIDVCRYATSEWRTSTRLFRNFIWFMILLSVSSVMNYQFMLRLFTPAFLFIPILFLQDIENLRKAGKKITARYALMCAMIGIAFVFYFGQTYGYHALTF